MTAENNPGNFTFPLFQFFIFSPARPCNGFTLVELVAVLAIMSFCAFMSAGIFIDKTDQECFTQTVFKMEEIKKALLGVHSKKVRLRQGFAGFISHMGGLPPLNADAQPEGLWKWEQAEDDNGWKGDFKIKNYDLSENGYKERYEPFGPGNGSADKNWTYMGWRGPYIDPPGDGMLRDGWGNPFIFKVSEGDLRITSAGANGVINSNDKGFDADIVMTIGKNRYICSVAGYVDISEYSHGIGDGVGTRGRMDKANLRVVMHYPAINEDGHVVDHRAVLNGMGNDIDESGFFRFENVPVGFRFIMAWEEKYDDPPGLFTPPRQGEHAYNSYHGPPTVFCDKAEKVKNLLCFLEPGENWIGHMSLQRDTHGRPYGIGLNCKRYIYPKD